MLPTVNRKKTQLDKTQLLKPQPLIQKREKNHIPKFLNHF